MTQPERSTGYNFDVDNFQSDFSTSEAKLIPKPLQSSNLVVNPEALKWQEEANCKGQSQEIFFPKRGKSTLAAKAICAACEVVDECLDFAVENNENSGIWGGMSEHERCKIRKTCNLTNRRRRFK